MFLHRQVVALVMVGAVTAAGATPEELERESTALLKAGKLQAAASVARDALAARLRLPPDAAEIAAGRRFLGNQLAAAGDFVAAEKELREARAGFKRQSAKDPQTLELDAELGRVSTLLGNFSVARPLLENRLAVQRKQKGAEHRETIECLLDLGALEAADGNLSVARTLLLEALETSLLIGGAKAPQTAQAAFQLAGVMGELKSARAEEMYQRARGLGDVLGHSHPDVVFARARYSVMLLKRMNHVSADEARKRSDQERMKRDLQEAEAILGDDHPGTLQLRLAIGEFAASYNARDSALESLDAARRAVQRRVMRILPTLTPAQHQAALQENDKQWLPTALSLAVNFPDDPRVAERTASWLLNSKGSSTTSLAFRGFAASVAEDSQLQAIAERLQAVRKNLAVISQTKGTGRDQPFWSVLDEFSREERELSGRLAKVGLPEPLDWIELEKLRAALPKDGLFVDLARFSYVRPIAPGWTRVREQRESIYVAWIVPAAGQGDVQAFRLGSASALDAAVRRVRESIARSVDAEGSLHSLGEVAAEKEVCDELTLAHREIWAPLAERFGEVKKIFLSPDGDLCLLPWQALATGDDRYLIEDYDLRVIDSGRQLLTAAVVGPKDARAMIFADADFDLAPEQAAAAAERILGPAAVTAASAAPRLPKVKRLPYTQAEARAVAESMARWKDTKPTIYEGQFALEAVVKRVRRPAILMLSTHGFFVPPRDKPSENPFQPADPIFDPLAGLGAQAANPLIRCGLLLAGCNRRPVTGEDGVLTGPEILELDLRGTELVVLSACETAVGQVHDGEGVAGLRQAFLAAGAKCVVATLWQIPDRDSALVMNDFFTALAEGQPKSAALRTAQLKRIAGRRETRNAAHPFFWAGWTITGSE